jgi:hypothetical protein
MMKNEPTGEDFGVGATEELSLRVSVAALVRLLLTDPKDGRSLLALERKATLQEQGSSGAVQITVQPFGGALRILDVSLLREAIGSFHFDSERSRAERDFRVFIRPDAWVALQAFCLQQLAGSNGSAMESDPTRELEEEFFSTMQMRLAPEQWTCKTLGSVIEGISASAAPVHSRGVVSARIFQVFEARIVDAALTSAIISASQRHSNHELETLAREDGLRGGRGWANTVLTLAWEPLLTLYRSLPPAVLNKAIPYLEHRLDETVAAILEGVGVPKYRRQ